MRTIDAEAIEQCAQVISEVFETKRRLQRTGAMATGVIAQDMESRGKPFDLEIP